MIDLIIRELTDDHILILRSTVAPGTTRKILEKIKKRLKAGIAFCPEESHKEMLFQKITNYHRLYLFLI